MQCGAGSTDCDSLLVELTLNEPQTTSDKATTPAPEDSFWPLAAIR